MGDCKVPEPTIPHPALRRPQRITEESRHHSTNKISEAVDVVYPELAHLNDTESTTALCNGRYTPEEQSVWASSLNEIIPPSPNSSMESYPQQRKAWRNPNRRPTPIPDLMSHIAKLNSHEIDGSDSYGDRGEADADNEGAYNLH